MKYTLFSFMSFCAMGVTALAQAVPYSTPGKQPVEPRKAWISVCALGQRYAPSYDKNYKEIAPDPSLLHPTSIYYQILPEPVAGTMTGAQPKPEAADLFRPVPLRLNIASHWEEIPMLSGNRLPFFKASEVPATATVEAPPSFQPYFDFNIPATSRGGVLFISRSWDPRRPAESSWQKPQIIGVPLETFMDQTTGQFRENLVLLTNTLPYPLAYRVGAQGGQLAPGGFACVALANVQNSSAPYKVQAQVSGKWINFEGAEGSLYLNNGSAAALVFYANFTRRKKDPLQVAQTSIRFPSLPQETVITGTTR